ncbi:glycosyltransferase [bacterium]|nr:MAG: glycosyltransferase [bacterium]
MSHPTNPKYIAIAGGLTGGPIAPLLAVTDYWRTKDELITPVIFDVRNSFGKTVAQRRNIRFYSITTGKLRRYWTIKNFLAPFLLLIGLIQSLYYLSKLRPRLVLGAGGFAQLPVMYAAWILRIPRVIHQQDVSVTLSNRLCTPIANLITTTFEGSIRDFPQGSGLGKKYIQGTKVYWTGNPASLPDKHSKFPADIKLNGELPVLLVFGGASGAAALNKIIADAVPTLSRVVEIIHITGPGKNLFKPAKNYHPIEILTSMKPVYEAVDVVLGRAGINTLTELAEFGKPGIIVPMPDTHQEVNAELIFRSGSAMVLDQNSLNGDLLVKAIRKIIFEPDRQKKYVTNLRKLFKSNAAREIVSLIEHTVLHKSSKQNYAK